MEDFLRGRLDLVQTLESDVVGATYADLILIITAVLSACASARWCGTGIDKKRFVELLVNHSPEDFHTTWVSVPALINGQVIEEKDTPYGLPGESSRIFRGEEIDLVLGDAKIKYPHVPVRKLRKHTYACLIYEWLRCGYAHEYCPHENITHVAASRRKARVSYIGRITPNVPNDLKRMVSFHLDYMESLARHHVSNLARNPSPQPDLWWVDQEE